MLQIAAALLLLFPGAGGILLEFIPGTLRCIVNSTSPGSAGNTFGYEVNKGGLGGLGAFHVILSI